MSHIFSFIDTVGTSGGGDENFSYYLVQAGEDIVIPYGQQMILASDIQIEGDLTVAGDLFLLDLLWEYMSRIRLKERATPTSNPPVDYDDLWVGTDGYLKKIDDTGNITTYVPAGTCDAIFIIDGGGSTITTGIKGDLTIDFACTINQVTLLADQSGSIVIDIWKDSYANYPPTVADTITASAKPTISSSTKYQDSTLTGWTTSISAGDTLRFKVDSVTSIQRVTLTLKVSRT